MLNSMQSVDIVSACDTLWVNYPVKNAQKKYGNERVHQNIERFLSYEEHFPQFNECIHKRQECVLYRKDQDRIPSK